MLYWLMGDLSVTSNAHFQIIIPVVVLGTLALKTRSIWCGFLIHVSVALSMDLAAIAQVHG